MITYPVNPTQRFTLIRISTGEILKRDSPWPTTGGPIAGLDPDLAWLEQKEAPRQLIDARLNEYERVEMVDRENEEMVIIHAIKPLPIAERRENAIQTAAGQFRRHLGTGELEALTVLLLAAVLRSVKEKTLTPAEMAMAARIKHLADVAGINYARTAALLKDIEKGYEPDLDAGWQEPRMPC